MNKFKFTYQIVVEAENSEQALSIFEDGLQVGSNYREWILDPDGWDMRMLRELPVVKDRIASLVEKDQYTNEKHSFSIVGNQDINGNWIFKFFPDENMMIEANWQLFSISAKRMADWLNTIEDIEWEKKQQEELDFVECPSCGGTGYVGELSCLTCNGTKQISRERHEKYQSDAWHRLMDKLS